MNKPVGQEVEEEEKMDEAVSSYFAGLFGDDIDLDMEESAKGSPVYNPPDPNAEPLTLKNMEVRSYLGCLDIRAERKYILSDYSVTVSQWGCNCLTLYTTWPTLT